MTANAGTTFYQQQMQKKLQANLTIKHLNTSYKDI